MDPAILVTAGIAGAVLLAVLLVLLGVAVRGRGRLRRDLDGTRAQLAALEAQLERVAAEQAAQVQRAPRPERAAQPAPEFVITTVGDARLDVVEAQAPAEPLTAGQFASVALGESLVRILSFGHGVRRALSAENRNRIAFEMRREVRRSRKQRRQELKEARRHLRSTQRADLGEDAA